VFAPNGQFSVSVEGGPKKVVIYPAAGPGETVELQGVHPERVLGWSPDSRLVLILADRNLPVAVSAQRPSDVRDDIMQALTQEKIPYAELRGSVAGPPIDLQAGPPSWSSGGDMLAYVCRVERPADFLRWRDPEQPGEAWQHESLSLPKGSSALLAIRVFRHHIGSELVQHSQDVALKAQLLVNVKNLAMALMVFAQDHDGRFPDAAGLDDLRAALRPHIKNDDVYHRIGSQEWAVRYLLPPRTSVSDLADPAATPTVAVEYMEVYDLIGFADGHARAIPKAAAATWQSQIHQPAQGR
jgi:hypothetical protein